MPYIGLEKRTESGRFDLELETVEEIMRTSGQNLEIIGNIDENRRVFIVLSIDELPEEFRRKVVEYEVKKAARLLVMVSRLIEEEVEDGE